MSRKKNDDNNSALLKCAAVFDFLAGQGRDGARPTDIAAALAVSPSWVSVNLPALEEIGWLERMEETSRWRLGRRFAQVAAQEVAELKKAENRISEDLNRWTRG
jgi:ArsR family transcriptional regulator